MKAERKKLKFDGPAVAVVLRFFAETLLVFTIFHG